MQETQLLSSEILPIVAQATIDDAIQQLEDYNLEQLPVVDSQQRYLGMISYEILSNAYALSTVQDIINANSLLKIAMPQADYPYKAAKLMVEFNLQVIPVIDEKEILQGVISQETILHFLVKDTGLQQSGGILLLEVPNLSYSLSEIARICETNDVSILNLQIKSIKEEDSMHIIIKTNTKDLSAVVAAFERFEYEVTAIGADLNINDFIKDRYDLLMNYLKL